MGHANDINRHGVYHNVKHNKKDLASKVKEYLNEVQMMQQTQQDEAIDKTPD